MCAGCCICAVAKCAVSTLTPTCSGLRICQAASPAKVCPCRAGQLHSSMACWCASGCAAACASTADPTSLAASACAWLSSLKCAQALPSTSTGMRSGAGWQHRCGCSNTWTSCWAAVKRSAEAAGRTACTQLAPSCRCARSGSPSSCASTWPPRCCASPFPHRWYRMWGLRRWHNKVLSACQSVRRRKMPGRTSAHTIVHANNDTAQHH